MKAIGIIFVLFAVVSASCSLALVRDVWTENIAKLRERDLKGWRLGLGWFSAWFRSLSSNGKVVFIVTLLLTALIQWGLISVQLDDWQKRNEERRAQIELEKQQRAVTPDVVMNANFQTSGDVKDWSKEKRLEIEFAEDGWKAHGATLPETVASLEEAYRDLLADEASERALKIIDEDVPGSSAGSRISELKKALTLIDDEGLSNQINHRIQELEKLNTEYQEKQARERAERERKEKEEREHQARIDRIAGTKPENSSWDAAVRPVVQFLKQNLKDPRSVEYIEWSQVNLIELSDTEIYWAVRCRYRAKNSFGGYVIEEQLFYIQHEQVVDFMDLD